VHCTTAAAAGEKENGKVDQVAAAAGPGYQLEYVKSLMYNGRVVAVAFSLFQLCYLFYSL